MINLPKDIQEAGSKSWIVWAFGANAIVAAHDDIFHIMGGVLHIARREIGGSCNRNRAEEGRAKQRRENGAKQWRVIIGDIDERSDAPGEGMTGKTSAGSVVLLGVAVSGAEVRAVPQARLFGPLFQTTFAV